MNRFDLESVKELFSGPGRTVEPWSDHDSRGIWDRYGVKISTGNGWSFSAIWGYGSYCVNGRRDNPAPWSPDAEVMPGAPGIAWTPAVDYGAVAGNVSPERLGAALVAAERDDAYGVVYCLSSEVWS